MVSVTAFRGQLVNLVTHLILGLRQIPLECTSLQVQWVFGVLCAVSCSSSTLWGGCSAWRMPPEPLPCPLQSLLLGATPMTGAAVLATHNRLSFTSWGLSELICSPGAALSSWKALLGAASFKPWCKLGLLLKGTEQISICATSELMWAQSFLCQAADVMQCL